jgi:hypothetical protein
MAVAIRSAVKTLRTIRDGDGAHPITGARRDITRFNAPIYAYRKSNHIAGCFSAPWPYGALQQYDAIDRLPKVPLTSPSTTFEHHGWADCTADFTSLSVLIWVLDPSS